MKILNHSSTLTSDQNSTTCPPSAQAALSASGLKMPRSIDSFDNRICFATSCNRRVRQNVPGTPNGRLSRFSQISFGSSDDATCRKRMFRLQPADLLSRRHGGEELDDSVIEQRNPRLERHGHADAVLEVQQTREIHREVVVQTSVERLVGRGVDEGLEIRASG